MMKLNLSPALDCATARQMHHANVQSNLCRNIIWCFGCTNRSSFVGQIELLLLTMHLHTSKMSINPCTKSSDIARIEKTLSNSLNENKKKRFQLSVQSACHVRMWPVCVCIIYTVICCKRLSKYCVPFVVVAIASAKRRAQVLNYFGAPAMHEYEHGKRVSLLSLLFDFTFNTVSHGANRQR